MLSCASFSCEIAYIVSLLDLCVTHCFFLQRIVLTFMSLLHHAVEDLELTIHKQLARSGRCGEYGKSRPHLPDYPSVALTRMLLEESERKAKSRKLHPES